jgi:hypothetical protein
MLKRDKERATSDCCVCVKSNIQAGRRNLMKRNVKEKIRIE